MEITLGSFLHTLRVPFAGVMLASLSTALLVAQRQMVPRRGVSVATGLIAALCKSISPGGIILGPMIGIATEGALIELALLAAPRALLPAAVAGALAALWAASQKLLTQVVIYGASIVELYLAALGRAADWLALPSIAGWSALGAFAAVVAGIGVAGGVIGHRMGRDAELRLRGGGHRRGNA
jgi:hypothetical protein